MAESNLPYGAARVLRHQIGKSNYLIEVAQFEQWMGLTRVTAFKTLRSLRVPLTHIGKQSYFNLHTLDRVLFYFNRLSGEGFAAPGSTFKNKNKHKSKSLGCPRIEVTDADIEKMSEPGFVAEWLATGSQHTARSTLFVQTLKEEKAKKDKERKENLKNATKPGKAGPP